MVPRPLSQQAPTIWLAVTVVAATVSLALWWKRGTYPKIFRTSKDDDDNDERNGSPQHPRVLFGYNKDGDEDEEHSVHIPEHLQREIDKEKRRQEKIPHLAMKNPMYDNIQMLDPDSKLLCTISLKKANWYVRKGLAVWKENNENDNDGKRDNENIDTDEHHATIQLLFEPSHRSNESSNTSSGSASGEDDDAKDEDLFFNKSIKENICVVCGDDQYHMRHYIVPYCCRSLFPNKFKMHLAHDVVILCPDCHLNCKKIATNRLKGLERQCRKDPNTAIPHFLDRKLNKVKSCASALLQYRRKLPTATIIEYEQLVRDHYFPQQSSATTGSGDNEELLTPSLLETAMNLETTFPNPNYIPTSEIVVASFCTNDAEIETFVRDWRQHFVDTMQPEHLPKGWHVDSSVECVSADRKGQSE